MTVIPGRGVGTLGHLSPGYLLLGLSRPMKNDHKINPSHLLFKDSAHSHFGHT